MCWKEYIAKNNTQKKKKDLENTKKAVAEFEKKMDIEVKREKKLDMAKKRYFKRKGLPERKIVKMLYK